MLPRACCTSKLILSRSPTNASKDNFEPIMCSLNLKFRQTQEHVGTHVREHDAFAIDL
jgi:hypothetical protein